MTTSVDQKLLPVSAFVELIEKSSDNSITDTHAFELLRLTHSQIEDICEQYPSTFHRVQEFNDRWSTSLFYELEGLGERAQPIHEIYTHIKDRNDWVSPGFTRFHLTGPNGHKTVFCQGEMTIKCLWVDEFESRVTELWKAFSE